MAKTTLHMRGRRVGGALPREPWQSPDRPAWMTDHRRACSPLQGRSRLWTSDVQAELNLAAAQCRRRCPFVRECRAWAIDTGQSHFTWGGMNLSKAEEREKAAAERPVVEPAPAPVAKAPASQRPRSEESLAAIRELWQQDRSDRDIALKIGIHPSTVAYIRKHVLGLPAKFGPGGSRRKVVAA